MSNYSPSVIEAKFRIAAVTRQWDAEAPQWIEWCLKNAKGMDVLQEARRCCDVAGNSDLLHFIDEAIETKRVPPIPSRLRTVNNLERIPSRQDAGLKTVRVMPKDAQVARPTSVIVCPSCSQQVRVPTDRGRLRVACPSCGTKWEWSLGETSSRPRTVMGFWQKLFGGARASGLEDSSPPEPPKPPAPSSSQSPAPGTKLAHPADVVELIETIFAPGTGAEYKQRKEWAEKQLIEHPNRAAAVTPLMSKYRDDPKENEYQICKLLEAIGTRDSSFELLLEIFSAGRKTKAPFDEWGNLKVENFGPNTDYATQPAYLLVCKIENGPSRLKKRLSQAEYEEVVARAHAWSGSDRPLLAQALAEIGSKLAVWRLLHDILQTHREQETRDPAIRALGSIGQRYLPLLTEELKFRRQDREEQTTYLRDILSVLAICGDKTCVDPIIELARRDASVEEDARRALAAIAGRDGNAKIPQDVGAQPIPVRRLNLTGDRYVDRCFECDWSELDEPRLWSSLADLKLVTDLANTGKDTEALHQLSKIWTKYEDHYFVYGWKSRILARQGHKSDAVDVLNEGMARCRRKYGLCDDRGDIEYSAGDLNEAVVWWIRSAVAQISADRPVTERPFLYLAYIANALGDHKSKDQLFKVVDRLTQFGRLNDSAVNRINSLVTAQRSRSMSVAIGRLCKEFL